MWRYAKHMSQHYRGNHLFIPWGDDFTYGNARLTYAPLDALIPYFNEHYDDMTLMYSTPTQFMEAIKKENIVWPVKYGDMLPYADRAEDYWTGYYTSRAGAKEQSRIASANLHASNKLYSEKAIQQDTDDATIRRILDAKYKMFDALGIMQHHDAITGTAKQRVADNYTEMIAQAMEVNNELFAKLAGERAA